MKEEEKGEDTKGLILIDDINGFNKLSCITIIWTVIYRCLSGTRFVLN